MDYHEDALAQATIRNDELVCTECGASLASGISAGILNWTVAVLAELAADHYDECPAPVTVSSLLPRSTPGTAP